MDLLNVEKQQYVKLAKKSKAIFLDKKNRKFFNNTYKKILTS